MFGPSYSRIGKGRRAAVAGLWNITEGLSSAHVTGLDGVRATGGPRCTH